ncbi:MAG: carbohydrate ABC transporter permease [Planctomycetota bacterium]
MSLTGPRVGQSTEPGTLVDDAALTEQADLRDQTVDYQAPEPVDKPLGLLARTSALHLLLAFLSLIISLPFLWMVLTSLKTVAEVDYTTWIPDVPQWRNYLDVFRVDDPTSADFDPNRQGVKLHLFFRNSFFVAAWVTFLQVLTSAFAAFSFARLKWPGRDKVFLLYLATMMLPGLIMSIPNYQIMIELGLVDTLPGLIIPAAFSAFGTFLLRQFMLTIPASLDEAAEIDGAGKLRLFFDIILPLSRPGVITLAIFTFMGNYNSFFWPLVMIKTEEKYPLQVGLLFFESSRGSSTHLLMAAVTLSVVPLIILFVCAQKYLVKGIQLGAVKG